MFDDIESTVLDKIASTIKEKYSVKCEYEFDGFQIVR